MINLISAFFRYDMIMTYKSLGVLSIKDVQVVGNLHIKIAILYIILNSIRQYAQFSHYHQILVFYQSFLCVVVALYARCFIVHYIREIDAISLFLKVKNLQKALFVVNKLTWDSSDLFSILLAKNLCGIAEIKQHKCFVLKEYSCWIANYRQTKIKVLVVKKQVSTFPKTSTCPSLRRMALSDLFQT